MASTLKQRPGPAPSGGEGLQVATGTILKLVWYDVAVPSIWSMRSTQAAAALDTDAAITLPEAAKALMKSRDIIWAQCSFGGSVESGIFTVDTVNASTGAVDLKNLGALGLSDTD